MNTEWDFWESGLENSRRVYMKNVSSHVIIDRAALWWSICLEYASPWVLVPQKPRSEVRDYDPSTLEVKARCA